MAGQIRPAERLKPKLELERVQVQKIEPQPSASEFGMSDLAKQALKSGETLWCYWT
jgi:hypothetical protein